MNAFEAYEKFIALKQHFNSNYDYFKYNGKMKTTRSSFESNRHRFFFEKLAKKKDVVGFIVSNMVYGNAGWVGDLFSEEAETNYVNWIKNKESLSYIFKNDISKLNEDFDKNFIVVDGQHPPLLKLFRQKKITIETLIILNDLIGFFNHWNKAIQEQILWPKIFQKTLKYKPFLEYDRYKMKTILKDKFL